MALLYVALTTLWATYQSTSLDWTSHSSFCPSEIDSVGDTMAIGTWGKSIFLIYSELSVTNYGVYEIDNDVYSYHIINKTNVETAPTYPGWWRPGSKWYTQIGSMIYIYATIDVPYNPRYFHAFDMHTQTFYHEYITPRYISHCITSSYPYLFPL
eukprot:84559_1